MTDPHQQPAPAPMIFPSLRKRMACWLYEGILLFGVVWISAYLYGTLTQTRHGMENRHGLQLFLFIIFGIYFTWFWHKGQTLAMKTWHLRVVGLDGQAISQGRALLRYVLSWLWFLPPLPFIAAFKLSGGETTLILSGWIIVYALLSRFHAQQQFVHDALAKTRLVSSQPMSR